jgi:MFS family permease
LTTTPLTPGALFAIADYRRLWAAGALTNIGRWLEFIALGIYAYEVTQSPPLVALLAVLRMMPYVLLGFFIGALADRFDRRRLLMGGTAVVCATALVMSAATGTGHGDYTPVAAATMVSGAFWTIDMPVRRRLLVDSVGSGNVARALGFDNSTNYATRALGPLIGGATYQILGIGGIYLMIASCYLLCFVMAWRLGTSASGTAGGQSVKAGWIAALKIPPKLIFNRRFAVIMGVTFVYNVTCFPFTTMVPVIAQKDFALAPALVGALSACDGLGGTIGALVVGALATERTLFRFYFFGVTTILCLIIALSFNLTVTATVPMLVLSGMAAAGFSATQYALVHVISPPEVRGRATGVLSLFIGSSMLGHYVAGQLFGMYPSAEAMRMMGVAGVIAMALLGMLWWGPRPKAEPA